MPRPAQGMPARHGGTALIGVLDQYRVWDMYGVWGMGYGARSMEHGAWNMAYDEVCDVVCDVACDVV